jgi:iron complex outermembrane receptor protein
MLTFTRRGHLRHLIHSCLVASIALPMVAQAQQDPEVEEVVVTGSYIRNSAFAQNSPVDTVTQEDLFESGAPSMGAYIRDLSYTQNTNVVNVVLGGNSGAQTGNSSFNLRGLGEGSTLTLIDGTRTISPLMSASLPEIAIGRMEMVLDGGSALYGSDAVAGVVNIIPIKQFDGFRARTYYQRTEDGAMEDMRGSFMWGKSFNNGVDYVGAFEVQKQTPLMMYERTREWKHSNNASNAGPVGSFREIVGADPGVNLLQPHGGTHTGPVYRDPDCGQFNEGFLPRGEGYNSNPSGTIFGANCTYDYSIQHAYSRHEVNWNLYNTVSYEATDWLRLNATLNNHYRVNQNVSTGTSPNGGNDRAVMKIPANHPANIWGVDLTPWSWRVFGNTGGNLPSWYNSDSSKPSEANYGLNRVKLTAEYDITGSWTGYTYYATQESKSTSDSNVVSSSRLQLAMSGMGGPNGDQWFNPFGSQSPYSANYVEGVTDNSQEMIDWLMLMNPNATGGRNELDIFETLATGEVFDLPAGAVQMAVGYQWRDAMNIDFADQWTVLGENYANSQVLGERQKDSFYGSEVRSVFMELEVPILETLAAQLAVRHEEFKDFGLESTTPKISLRWEALPTLALRASWGESFLAPSPFQARPFVADDRCADMYSGLDDFTNTPLIGGVWCQSGNPNLKPETSTIQNIGFTWEPSGNILEGLNLSVDYQEIEYVDRIRTLSQQDTATNQFNRFLAATGISKASYDPTPGSATRNTANAWLAQQAARPGNPILRAPDGTVTRLFAQAANVSSMWVDLIDMKAQYTMDTNDWGTFATTLQTTYYLTYDYAGLDGTPIEALGKQNGRTGLVPPLPEIKANARVNWFRGNQSASISANYWSSIDFDDQVVDFYASENGYSVLTPPRTIRGEYIFDVRYAHVFDQYFDSEFTLSAGVNNLFDKRPQRLAIIGGAETRLSVPWGRQFWLSLEWTPGM